FVLWDGVVTNIEGMITATLYLLYLYFIFKSEKMEGEKVEIDSKYKTIATLIMGLAFVIIGANLLVNSAIRVANHFGISSSIIGLTIVAVGTSLPELAVSITAALKRLPGLSIGNLIGSNITDPMFSMGIAASVNSVGMPVDPAIIKFDAPILIGVSVLALYLMGTDWKLTKREGALLVLVYILYLYVNFVIKI
ncbi:MAG: sodium:calcium antiporter, partial [Candidatus Hydrothermarchaeales archaeon]